MYKIIQRCFLLKCFVYMFLYIYFFFPENGIYMFLWLGLSLPNEWVQMVFGVPTVAQVDSDKTSLPILENPLSLHIRSLIDSVRSERHRCMRVSLYFVLKSFRTICSKYSALINPYYVQFIYVHCIEHMCSMCLIR